MTSKHFPTSRKLSGDEQVEICRRIAFFEKPTAIIRAFQEEHGKKISTNIVYHYQHSPQWAPLIQKYRDTYNSQLLEIPLAHKRKRVEELVDLYEECRTDKKSNEARQTLEQIRIEVEGKREENRPNIFINQDFRQLSDEDLEEKRLEALELVAKYRKVKAKEIEIAEPEIEVLEPEEKEGE